jgi:hypothetical protein
MYLGRDNLWFGLRWHMVKVAYKGLILARHRLYPEWHPISIIVHYFWLGPTQTPTWLSARCAPSVSGSGPAGLGFFSAWTSVLSRYNSSFLYRCQPPQGRYNYPPFDDTRHIGQGLVNGQE